MRQSLQQLDYVKASRSKRRRDRYIEWAAEYFWKWIGVLTLRSGIRARRARTLLLEWMDFIQIAEKHPISFFAVREFGSANELLHYHVVIAGIGSRLQLYLPRWKQTSGFSNLAKFRSTIVRNTPDGLRQSSGIAYALKTLNAPDAEFELDLHDEHLLPRFKRARVASQELGQNGLILPAPMANGGHGVREALLNDR